LGGRSRGDPRGGNGRDRDGRRVLFQPALVLLPNTHALSPRRLLSDADALRSLSAVQVALRRLLSKADALRALPAVQVAL
jgi:hypothetical protein